MWHFLITLKMALILMLLSAGCGSDIGTGVAIGVAGSQAAQEARQLLQEDKMALVAEIIALRAVQDANGLSPEAVYRLETLETELARLETVEATADLTEEGITRSWHNNSDNWRYAVSGVIAMLMGTSYQQYRRRKKYGRVLADLKVKSPESVDAAFEKHR